GQPVTTYVVRPRPSIILALLTDVAATELYPLSLHDALPILPVTHAILKVCRTNSTQFHAASSSASVTLMQMTQLNPVQQLKKNQQMDRYQLVKTWILPTSLVNKGYASHN